MSQEAFELWWGDVLDENHYECALSWCAWEARDPEIAAKDARIAKLEAELRKILELVGESRGVVGFHLNGEVAEWGYFDLPQTIEEVLR